MMFWTREVVGWALVGLGLLAFGVTYFGLLRNGRIFESMILGFIGFIVFRGGIHLVKVAVAAHICRQTAEAGRPRVTVHSATANRPLPGVRPTAALPPLPADTGPGPRV